MTQPPNLLIILADQHRGSALRCAGNPDVITPHFDALAQRGTRSTHCFSASPVCSPYRATLQTGLYPHQHGVYQNNLRVRTDVPNLASCLNAAGYKTGYIGKAHWWDSGKPGYYPQEARLGWQHWVGFNRGHFHWDLPVFDETQHLTHAYKGRYSPEVVTDLALDFIDQSAEGPWACQLNWGPPHNATMDEAYADSAVRAEMKRLNDQLGFGLSDKILDDPKADDPKPVSWFPQALTGTLLPQAYLDMYDPAALTIEPNVSADLRAVAAYYLREYYAMITSLDDQLARIMHQLRASGQLENTIILYTSDHGDYLGSHGHGRGKGMPYQNAVRVPFLVSGPGIPQGVCSDTLINSVDLMPTILSLLGIDAPESVAGVSVAAQLQGTATSSQQDILLGLGKWRALSDGRYLYAHIVDDNGSHPLHLFDMQSDPHDLQNLLDDPAHAARAEAMRTRLIARLRQEKDDNWLQRAGV